MARVARFFDSRCTQHDSQRSPSVLRNTKKNHLDACQKQIRDVNKCMKTSETSHMVTESAPQLSIWFAIVLMRIP